MGLFFAKFWSLSLIVVEGADTGDFFFVGDEADGDDVDDAPPLDILLGAALVTGETLLNPLNLFVDQAEMFSLGSPESSLSEFST